ncbi:MAG TPA: PadR family transcriptional regulator [Acidimicrobiales bacterium]|nr:PadR family transcriptional regulator [Acidimicrobiales bacterium]
MSKPPSLTPTSYLVLGLVARQGECTSYDMKVMVSNSIGYFWTFPHSQLYAEPARLAELGLLSEEQETTGRKRRTYRLTDAGHDALCEWLAEPTDEPTEIRDLSVLKLFFGRMAEPHQLRDLADHAAAAHRRRLSEYEAIAQIEGIEEHERATLEMGLEFERFAIGYWDGIAKRF